MYKPHTIEQYKVYRFLEENFALEHFLLAPLSRFGLILEDKTGEKIAFAFLNNCVQEIPVPAPAAPETVTAFLKQFRSLTPRPVIHDFEADPLVAEQSQPAYLPAGTWYVRYSLPPFSVPSFDQ